MTTETPGPVPAPPISDTPPWERRSELGPLTAFVTTLGGVLAHPRSFFERLDPRGPVGSALVFWALTTLPPLVVSGAGSHDFLERLPALLEVDPSVIPFHFPLWMFVVVLPLLQCGSLFGAVLLIHGMLALLGGATGGLRGTLRAAGYGAAPALVSLVPLVGGLVAGLWVGILQYYALFWVHRCGHGRLLLAYLLPAILAVVAGLALAAALVPVLTPLVERLFSF
jgi:hypothetical protein